MRGCEDQHRAGVDGEEEMEIKRFLADDVREGMLSVRNLLGPDAVILSNRRMGNRIEILATKEFDAESIDLRHGRKKRPAVEVSDVGRQDRTFANDSLRPKDAAIAPERAARLTSSDLETSEAQSRRGLDQRGLTARSTGASSLSQNLSAIAAADRTNQRRNEVPLEAKESAHIDRGQVTGESRKSDQEYAAYQPGNQPNRLGMKDMKLPDEGRNVASDRPAPASPKAIPTLNPATRLMNLSQELIEIKTLLKRELGRLRTLPGQQQIDENEIRGVLMDLGVMGSALTELTEAMVELEFDAQSDDANLPAMSRCDMMKRVVADRIKVTGEDLIQGGGIYAVIGASGVGKTTTVAKMAARYAIQHGRSSVALITTDAFKIGGQDQLATFGKLLGIGVHTATDEEQLIDVLKRSMDKQLVLIDSAGMSERDVNMNKHLSRIKMHGGYARNILVSSATSLPGLAGDVVEHYAHAPIHAAVLTKLDEAANLGSGLSTMVQTGLHLAYCCDGQSLSDIHLADITVLLKQAFAKIREVRDIDIEMPEVVQQHA